MWKINYLEIKQFMISSASALAAKMLMKFN